MKKIKETITALTSGETPGGVQVKKEEKEPMSDERFSAILKCIVKVAVIAATTKIVPEIGTHKLLVLGGIILALEVAYFFYDKGVQ